MNDQTNNTDILKIQIINIEDYDEANINNTDYLYFIIKD